MSQEQNIYKELYEAQQANKGFQETLSAVIARLSQATGYDIKSEGATLEGLLDAVDAKCGFVAPVEAVEAEAKE